MTPNRRFAGTDKSGVARIDPAAGDGISWTLYSPIAGAYCVLIGVLVLIGWHSAGTSPIDAWPEALAMRPNAALAFLLAGLSLLLFSFRAMRPIRTWIACGLAILTLAIGLATLLEYATWLHVDIDELLFPVSSTKTETPHPARMHTLSATSFVVIGFGLLLLEWSARSAQFLSLAAGWLGLLASLGHLFGVSYLSGWGTHAQMPLLTAVSLIVLSLGLLLARPNERPVAVLLGQDAGGLAARRLLPPVMAVLVLAGVLTIYGEQNGWFEVRLGILAMVLSSIAILTTLIWLSAQRLAVIDHERRIAEQTTSEQRDWLATTLSSIADAVVTADTEGRITFLNRVAEQLTGWSRTDATGRLLQEVVQLIDEQTRSPAPDPVQRALSDRNSQPAERPVLLIRRDGSEIPVSDSASAIRRGPHRTPHGVVHVIRDVRSERQAEAALRDSEAKFRSILNNTSAAIFAKDRNGRYLIGNRHLAQMFGWNDESWPLGKTDAELFPQEMAESFVANDRKVLEADAALEFEEAVVQDGRTSLFLVQKFPLRDANGTTYGVCGIANDITRRKRNELILQRQAQQQHAAAELGWVALTQRDLQRMMDHTVETVAGVLDHEYCKILELLPDGQRLLLRAGVGWKQGLVGSATIGADLESQAGYTLNTTDPVVVENLAEESRFSGPPLLHDHGVVSGMSCVIPGPDGKPWGVLGTHTTRRFRHTSDDVSFLQTVAHIVASAIQRSAVEAALRESEQRLRFALNAAGVGSWDWDVRTGRVEWSESMEAIYDLAPGTFGGTLEAALDFIFPSDRPQVEEAIDHSLTSGEGRFEATYRIRRADGSLGWIHAQGRSVFDRHGSPVRMAGICMDISQRHRSDELTRLLAEAGAHLGQSYDYESSLQIVAELLVPVFGDWCAIDLLDRDQQLQSVAIVHSDSQKIAAARELRQRYRPQPGDSIGVMRVIETGEAQLLPEFTDEMLQVTAHDDVHLDALRELGLYSAMIVPLEARGRTLGTLTLLSAESRRRYTSDDLGPVQELAIRCALAVDNGRLYEDVQRENEVRERTERLLAKAHDAAAAANAAKSEFLANMSHEIRTPMTAVLGYTDILSEHLEDPDDLQCVETIRRNGQFLLEIVNDILDLSKIEAGKLDVEPERFRPDELVADVLSLMEVRASEKQLSLRAEFDGPLPETIQSDPTRLRQILINLVGNAIKFTEAGAVTLGVRILKERRLLEVTVQDTGIGISAKQMARLFEPFSQADTSVARNYGGTGLGLSISRRLAEMLGGEIQVRSELGQGSAFIVTVATGPLDNIPFVEPDNDVCAAPEVPQLSSRLNCRVLVVDDRRDIRYLAEHFICDAGGCVVTAGNGKEALEEIERRRVTDEPIDVVLMDVQMPVMDGYEAALRLREEGVELPIIALTANAMQRDRERCLEAGFDDYTSKPLNGPQLVEMLARYTQEVAIDELPSRRAPSTACSPSPVAEIAASPPAEESTGCRVLFVDDSEDLCRMMSMLLESRGHVVQTARDGRTALEFARVFAPEVVLLDLTLPDMSGCAVAVQLRSLPQTQDAVLIAVSGDNQQQTLQDVEEAGFHHYLLKPVDVDDLERHFPICTQVG